MDCGKTDNERELTSTMGNVLSGSIKDEKSDTNDATPTSSTDANTRTTSSQIVSDDPISSTSSDIVELNKPKNLGGIKSSVETNQGEMEDSDKAAVDPETDLLEMSISSVSRERITEDVEDLVHDLESLLGESTDSFNIPMKRKDQKSPEIKENTEKPQPSGGGDTLEISVLDENIEVVPNDTEEDVLKNICNSSPVEAQTQESEDNNIQEIDSCNTNIEESTQNIRENPSEESKESPVFVSFETETASICKNVAENPEEGKSDITTVDNENVPIASRELQDAGIKDIEYVTAPDECSEVEDIKEVECVSEVVEYAEDGDVKEVEYVSATVECSEDGSINNVECVTNATNTATIECSEEEETNSIVKIDQNDDMYGNTVSESQIVIEKPTEEKICEITEENSATRSTIEEQFQEGIDTNVPTTESEGELKTTTSDASSSDYNIQAVEEKSKEANTEANVVCYEENILRDAKTETVECIDYVYDESNKEKISESQITDKTPINDSSVLLEDNACIEKGNTIYSEISQERNVEEVAAEIYCDTNDNESKSDEVVVVENYISESTDHQLGDQTDIIKTENIINQTQTSELSADIESGDGATVIEISESVTEIQASELSSDIMGSGDSGEVIEISESVTEVQASEFNSDIMESGDDVQAIEFPESVTEVQTSEFNSNVESEDTLQVIELPESVTEAQTSKLSSDITESGDGEQLIKISESVTDVQASELSSDITESGDIAQIIEISESVTKVQDSELNSDITKSGNGDAQVIEISEPVTEVETSEVSPDIKESGNDVQVIEISQPVTEVQISEHSSDIMESGNCAELIGIPESVAEVQGSELSSDIMGSGDDAEVIKISELVTEVQASELKSNIMESGVDAQGIEITESVTETQDSTLSSDVMECADGAQIIEISESSEYPECNEEQTEVELSLNAESTNVNKSESKVDVSHSETVPKSIPSETVENLKVEDLSVSPTEPSIDQAVNVPEYVSHIIEVNDNNDSTAINDDITVQSPNQQENFESEITIESQVNPKILQTAVESVTEQTADTEIEESVPDTVKLDSEVIQPDILKTVVESVTEQTADTEIKESVADLVKLDSEVTRPELEEIVLVSNIIDQHETSIEPVDDSIVAQLEEPLNTGISVKEVVETEMKTLAGTLDKKCEEEKLQPEITSENIVDVSELVEDKIKTPRNDYGKEIRESSTSQTEIILNSETVVEANITVAEPDDERVPINLDKLCSEVVQSVVDIDLGCEPSNESTSSAGDVSNILIVTSKSTNSELSNIVVDSVGSTSVESTSVESTSVESSKLSDNTQLQPDQNTVLEEIAAEVDKQLQDIDWVEDLTNENKEGINEEFQDEEPECAVVDKDVIVLDEDSKSEGVDIEPVPFISSDLDSNSEDTVPTLILEPDDVSTSPKQSNTEVEITEIEESSIPIGDATETSDKLPEIEEILNDQGNIEDVVEENIDMQENLETILAVAALQKTATAEVVEKAVIEPPISDKERREMEALRKAVESITDTSTTEYGEVEEITEFVKGVIPLSQSISSEVVDNLLERSDSDVKKIESTIEESVTISTEVIDSQDVKEEATLTSSKLDDEIVESCTTSAKKIAKTEESLVSIPDTSEDNLDASEQPQNVVPDLPDSSQGISSNEENKPVECSKERENKIKISERPKRHKKSTADNKLEELSINVDVPEREKPYSPKVTIKPIKVPDEEVSTTSNSDSEVGKVSLKMTITKQSDKLHSILKICDSDNLESTQEQEEPIPKLIIKPKMQQVEQQHSPKMSTRSSKQMYSPTSSSQRSGSPRITIKPVVKPDKVESVTPLKIKIKPDEGSKKHSPKLNIKPVTKPEEECRESILSPRKVIIKPVVKSSEETEQMQSPRITIKPIPKPDAEKEFLSITPKINIKLMKKQEEDDLDTDREKSSPKITIKPVIKPQESDTQIPEADDEVKERIVLKINKGNLPPTPTKESKKREHPPDDEKSEKLAKITVKFSKGGGHPHIVQHSEESNKRPHEEQSSPEKVKRSKIENESPVLTRSKHKEVDQITSDTGKTKHTETEIHIVETRSKHTHSVCDAPIEIKRAKFRESTVESPRSRVNNENSNDSVKIIECKNDSPIIISEDSRSQDSGSCVILDDLKDPLGHIDVYEIPVKSNPETPPNLQSQQESGSSTPSTPTTVPRKRGRPRKVPIVVREEFKDQEESPKLEPPKKEEPPQSQVHDSGRPKRSCRGQSARMTLGIKPRKPRGPGRGRGSKRGMGTRTVPMKSQEDPKLSKGKLKLIHETLKVQLLRTDGILIEKELKKTPEAILVPDDEDIELPTLVVTQSERLPIEVPPSPSTLQFKPSSQDPATSPALSFVASPKPASSLVIAESVPPESVPAESLPVESVPAELLPAESVITEKIAVETVYSAGVPSATPSTSRVESAEIVMVDEETRMSADTNSRAQTPAKQVIPSDIAIEESQSSVQSTATTESGKAASSRPNKAPRLEVQEPEGAVISADQLTEYYWNGNGPFMLQEQVAQYLGIKSFKRKYPGIMRRMLEMQERDFIRESGLASEHMCDLGLTAVNSVDILDIMYSDFQEKYEEYCKHQRDRQAKELINKQKALSLAASQDKNKADITEQAVHSAAQWNASFNRTRKEQRKACMDLQTLTVHYPKGKMKQINKSKVGNYPVSLVPGQFTDYYKDFTPTEINNLPLSTMCYEPINIIPPEESDDSGSEGSDSDSDSSSSSSGSCSSSSGVEDCKLCKHTPKKGTTTK